MDLVGCNSRKIFDLTGTMERVVFRLAVILEIVLSTLIVGDTNQHNVQW